MNTVPTGWPSPDSGPASPVIATPRAALPAFLAPTAMDPATWGLTAPNSSSCSRGTPSTSCLISQE